MVTPRQQRRSTKRQREISARRAELVASYIAESTLASSVAKETLASTLAIQVIHLELLHDQEAAGTLGAEDARTIPACVSTIKRLSDSLGLKANEKPVSDAELLGDDW